ncbi:hypothetical protein BX666DRAFT_1878349 [Dichotomocladium elegans]|nr:hypothetical protein BX666DRAFT_1878349 [Dichotomocladium elegans]
MKKTLYTLLLAVLLLAADAVPLIARAPADDTTIELPISGHTVAVHGVVLSILLFVSGAYLCFLGGVHQKTTMFLVGFYIGSNVAYVVLVNARDDYGSNTSTILLVVSLVAGVLVGAIMSCCFFIAIYLLGALLGYLAALWFLSWNPGGVITSNWGRAVLIVCFVIAGVILMAIFERAMVVIATSFIGSFAIFVGIDLYLQTGLAAAVASFLNTRSLSAIADAVQSASGPLRGMLGGTLGLAILSCLIQWLIIRRKDHSNQQLWSQQYPMRAGPGYNGWRRVD